MTELPDRPGAAAFVFKVMADAGVVVDMIIQNVGRQDWPIYPLLFRLKMPSGQKKLSRNTLLTAMVESLVKVPTLSRYL